MLEQFITAVLALLALWVLIWFVEQIFGEIPKPVKVGAALIITIIIVAYFLRAYGFKI